MVGSLTSYRPYAMSPAMESKPVVLVVDDDVSVRESLEGLIRHAGWRCETFASATDFLAHPRAPGASCLVLDINLPDLSGLELQERVATDRLDMPIIFITGHGDVPQSVRAMKAGAVEFLTKPFSDTALLNAIRGSLDRSSKTLEGEAELKAITECFTSLSRREQEVMTLVVTGRLNKQVAAMLRISEITVKAHRGRMMRKMHANSLPELVTIAARLHLPRA